jgi:hypothetical protein
MNSKDNNRNQEKAGNRHASDNGLPHFGRDLEVGRILTTYPRYGRLDIYVKRDKTFGAAFICEENGGRYGVTQGVREHLSDPGGLPPNYMPVVIRELSRLCVLFGVGEGPDEAGAEAKQDAAKAAGVIYPSELCGR